MHALEIARRTTPRGPVRYFVLRIEGRACVSRRFTADHARGKPARAQLPPRTRERKREREKGVRDVPTFTARRHLQIPVTPARGLSPSVLPTTRQSFPPRSFNFASRSCPFSLVLRRPCSLFLMRCPLSSRLLPSRLRFFSVSKPN